MDSSGDRGAAPPLLRAKSYEQHSLFEPEKLVREARRQLNLPSGDIPPVIVLDPDGDVVRYVRATRNLRRVRQWSCYHSTMWGLRLAGVSIGIVPNVVGGPYAVLVGEQAFAAGCRLLVDLTSAGRVEPLAQLPPYFVVIEKAWRDEGTSLHYLAPTPWSLADPELLGALEGLPATAAGQPVLRGASWTTDAPFRETPDALAHAREAGTLTVEMEAASLYAFGTARGLPVLCVAHVTNDVIAVEAADFEKGEEGGAIAALELLEKVILAVVSSGRIRVGTDRASAGRQRTSRIG